MGRSIGGWFSHDRNVVILEILATVLGRLRRPSCARLSQLRWPKTDHYRADEDVVKIHPLLWTFLCGQPGVASAV